MEIKKDIEYERMRLAACGVAAMANTDETVKQRLTPDHVYYSASYGDVCKAVDREIKYRKALIDIVFEFNYPNSEGYARDIAVKALSEEGVYSFTAMIGYELAMKDEHRKTFYDSMDAYMQSYQPHKVAIEIDLEHCPKCGVKTNTFKHPFAKVWCEGCGHVLREEGDKTIVHRIENNERT